MTTPLYLEDFALGQSFRSESLTVSLAEVLNFAAAYDPQPFHLDEAAGRASLFGALAASGWHTAALTMKLLVTSGLPVAGGIIGAGSELRWPKPMYPGDTIVAQSEVVEIRVSKSNPSRGMIKVKTTTTNQHGAAVLVLTADMVVPCRPAA